MANSDSKAAPASGSGQPPAAAPPSYYASGTSQNINPPVTMVYTVERRRSPGFRFCRAFIVAIIVWFLCTSLIQSIVSLAHHGHRHGVFGDWDYTIPSDISLDRCVTEGQWWADRASLDVQDSTVALPSSVYPFSSETTFDLPLSSDTLFLLSRGPQSAGSVAIQTSSQQNDVVQVNVVVHYFREDIRDSAKACLIRRKDGENGVGIFTPRRRFPWGGGQRERLFFETTITFPSSGDGTPLSINKFETDVPNTIQRIEDLAREVQFESILLRGSNAMIDVKSLYSHSGQFHTSNGPIQGIFNSSKSLTLSTSNAPIRVDIGLESDKTSKVDLNMRTSNNVLESHISLLSTSKTRGTFDITGRTSNGPLSIEFPTSPVDSTLYLDASTSNGPAAISLHPAYEGAFSLHTSNKAPSVTQRQNVEDPSGKSRKRQVHIRSTKNTIDGTVAWSSMQGDGHVRVKSSNALVVLEL